MLSLTHRAMVTYMETTEIRNNIEDARHQMEHGITAKARREGAEDLEFWTNKAAAQTIAERNGWEFAR